MLWQTKFQITVPSADRSLGSLGQGSSDTAPLTMHVQHLSKARAGKTLSWNALAGLTRVPEYCLTQTEADKGDLLDILPPRVRFSAACLQDH